MVGETKKVKPEVKVSLVMASFLRADLLDLSLNSIVQNLPAFPLEIVVVNDGLENDGTKEVCEKYSKKLNIHYYFSGQRNRSGLIKRNPCQANNIAIRKSKGEMVILTCPEILHLNYVVDYVVNALKVNEKRLVVPSYMFFDNAGEYTASLRRGQPGIGIPLLKRTDHVIMPFLMGVWRKEIEAIGGYDEDFTGYASEDNDFVERLTKNGCIYYRVKAQIVHLYHGKNCSGQKCENMPEWVYNRDLYEARKNIIVRNVGRNWGCLEDEEKYQNLNMVYNVTEVIPKILHLYWDESPMAELQTMTVTTFHKKNPDWKIRIYVPIQKYVGKNMHYVPDYTGDDYFGKIKYFSCVEVVRIDLEEYGIDPALPDILRSDIFRYNILYDVGGVWSDFDVLWLKSMEYLYKMQVGIGVPIKKMGTSVCQFRGRDGSGTGVNNTIGVIISRPRHPLYRRLMDLTMDIQKCNKDREKLLHQAFGTNILDVLFPTLEEMQKTYPDVVGFPYKTFYPYSIFELEQLYTMKKLENIDEEVVAVHWFNGHRLSKDYINNMGESIRRNCTMSKLMYLIKNGLL